MALPVIAHKLISGVRDGDGGEYVIEYDIEREALIIHNDKPGDEHDLISIFGGREIDDLIVTLVALREKGLNIS